MERHLKLWNLQPCSVPSNWKHLPDWVRSGMQFLNMYLLFLIKCPTRHPSILIWYELLPVASSVVSSPMQYRTDNVIQAHSLHFREWPSHYTPTTHEFHQSLYVYIFLWWLGDHHNVVKVQIAYQIVMDGAAPFYLVLIQSMDLSKPPKRYRLSNDTWKAVVGTVSFQTTRGKRRNSPDVTYQNLE